MGSEHEPREVDEAGGADEGPGTGEGLAPSQHRRLLGPRHDDVWGDERSEVDASAVVAEMETREPALARRWQDHPLWVPFRAVGRFVRRSGKRVGVAIVGTAVVIAGVALLVLPGPGWLLIFAGLAILATEFMWARRLLEYAKEKATQAKDAVLRKGSEEGDPPGGPESEEPAG